jgi:CRP-like cAMP-binding protein
MFQLISSVPIFKGIEPRHLEILKLRFEFFSCPPGRIIFNQGDAADYLYIILHGILVIRYKPYDGPEMTLTQLQEGSACGWSAVIGKPSYTTTVISKGKLEALRIKGNELRNICKQYPETGEVVLDRLASSVSNRWKDANLQIRQILDSDSKLKGIIKVKA